MTLRRRRATDCKFQVPDDQETSREKFFNRVSQARRTHARHRATDCISQVSRHWETGRIKFRSGFDFSRRASLVNPADSHNVVVEQLVLEPKEKTP